jgi:hypothetical protein
MEYKSEGLRVLIAGLLIKLVNMYNIWDYWFFLRMANPLIISWNFDWVLILEQSIFSICELSYNGIDHESNSSLQWFFLEKIWSISNCLHLYMSIMYINYDDSNIKPSIKFIYNSHGYCIIYSWYLLSPH